MLWMSCQLICRFVFHLMCSNTADLTAIASPTTDSLNWISIASGAKETAVCRHQSSEQSHPHEQRGKEGHRLKTTTTTSQNELVVLCSRNISQKRLWTAAVLCFMLTAYEQSRDEGLIYYMNLNDMCREWTHDVICWAWIYVIYIYVYIYLLLIIVYLYVQLYACSGVSRDSRVTFSGLPWGVACWRSGYDSKKNFERYL